MKTDVIESRALTFSGAHSVLQAAIELRRPFASRSASRLSIAAATFSPSQAWTVPRTDVLEGQREGQLERQPEAAVEKTIDMVGEGDSYFFKNHLANNDHDISGRLTRVLAVNTPPVD